LRVPVFARRGDVGNSDVVDHPPFVPATRRSCGSRPRRCYQSARRAGRIGWLSWPTDRIRICHCRCSTKRTTPASCSNTTCWTQPVSNRRCLRPFFRE
jgi:hypothetical protein